jgi:hypothetical protein
MRNISNCRARAAGTKIKAPKAVSIKPYMIPFLNPTFFNRMPEGMAMTKYAI